MYDEGGHDKEVHKVVDTTMPDGPEQYTQGPVSPRSQRIAGKRYAQRGTYLIGGGIIVVIVIILSSLGFFSGTKQVAGPIPDVPVANSTQPPASTSSLDNALPKSPKQERLTTPPPANGAVIAGTSPSPNGTGDALQQSLDSASNTKSVPTFAPSTTAPTTTAVQQNSQPQYANVPPPQQQTPATVPNPGAVSQPAPQYQRENGRMNIFIGDQKGDSSTAQGNQSGQSGQTNQGSSAPTTDRMTGSEPVPPANGSLYQPQGSGAGSTGGGGARSNVESNIAYANSHGSTPAYLVQTRVKAVGKTEIWAGNVIAAELDTGINTNLPGMATAHIVHDVYDSRTGQFLLIPKGTRVIGEYNAVVSNGQNRVQTKWERLIWPDGSYLSLEGMAGGDREGNSGNFADVNDHRGSVFTSSIFTGLLAAGTQLISGGQAGSYTTGGNGQVIYQSIGQQISQQGNEAIKQKMAQPPELTVPRGVNFNIIIDRTIVLDPWKYGS